MIASPFFAGRLQQAHAQLDALNLAPAHHRVALILLGKLQAGGHTPERIERAGGAAQFVWDLGDREMTVLVGVRDA